MFKQVRDEMCSICFRTCDVTEKDSLALALVQKTSGDHTGLEAKEQVCCIGVGRGRLGTK
jgi:hypothetical protein